ncbi:respiratory nitrate reductase subunit gamma [Candidatus Spongiihabitans sp.]|uniref:respiratory nitrate reductase subunit gamma n=1 Tax=Candidatus Spongiihabitans sp. TaxID=3101308 RepID=UPI003C7CDAAC
MTTSTTITFAVMFYLATAVLVLGVARKIIQYARTPAPLKIPTTPAPTTKAGVAARLFREIVLFESLFKGSKWTWLFGWLFHFGLLIVLMRHLRYFTEPVWWLAAVVNNIGVYMGWVMVIGLLGLLARRYLVDRIRYISSPSDFLMLFLIIAIGVSGLLIKHVFHSDIVQLKAFMLGLIKFNWQPLPPDPILLIHLSLVIVLMLIFPISKLLHAPGIVFSPTLNQVDNPREHRHVTPWANPELPSRTDKR